MAITLEQWRGLKDGQIVVDSNGDKWTVSPSINEKDGSISIDLIPPNETKPEEFKISLSTFSLSIGDIDVWSPDRGFVFPLISPSAYVQGLEQ